MWCRVVLATTEQDGDQACVDKMFLLQNAPVDVHINNRKFLLFLYCRTFTRSDGYDSLPNLMCYVLIYKYYGKSILHGNVPSFQSVFFQIFIIASSCVAFKVVDECVEII